MAAQVPGLCSPAELASHLDLQPWVQVWCLQIWTGG